MAMICPRDAVPTPQHRLEIRCQSLILNVSRAVTHNQIAAQLVVATRRGRLITAPLVGRALSISHASVIEADKILDAVGLVD